MFYEGSPSSSIQTLFRYSAACRPSQGNSRRADPSGVQADAVTVGAAIRVVAGDLALAVFNVDGEFFVTDDACTHGPGFLSEGYIEDDVVESASTTASSSIRTGEVVSPPCMIPVKTYPAKVENGVVVIEVD